MSAKTISVRLSAENDKDIIAKLNRVESISSYVKGLISESVGIETGHRDDPSGNDNSVKRSVNSFFSFVVNPETEGPIYEKLESVKNRHDFICSLIQDDISKASGKSWRQLSNEIPIDEYRDAAIFAAAQFSELADLLAKAGCSYKSDECSELAEKINAWAAKIH